jgi:hypothetical protein
MSNKSVRGMEFPKNGMSFPLPKLHKLLIKIGFSESTGLY